MAGWNAILAGLLVSAGMKVSPLPAQQQTVLPEIPVARGALALKVAYPEPGSRIVAGDSTFIFGSLGSGAANLRINGLPVPVAANGAWLAWIPIPPDSAFSLQLSATLGTDTVRSRLPLSRADWIRRTGAWVDPASLNPSGRIWLPDGEELSLSLRAAPDAQVRLRLADGTVIPFVPTALLHPVRPGVREFDRDERNLSRRDLAEMRVASLPASYGGVTDADWLDTTRQQKAAFQAGRLEVVLGADTTRLSWPLEVSRIRSPAMVRIDDGVDDSPWRTLTGRPLPGRGTYTWFFPKGTQSWADARINNEIRLRTSSRSIAWLARNSIHPLRLDGGVTLTEVTSLTLTPGADWTTLRIPLAMPVPYQVSEGIRQLSITLHGAVGLTDWTRYGADDPFVKAVDWRQETEDRFVITLEFDRPLWGWRSRVSGSDLLFDLRKPPELDPAAPLSGRRIVVDAGHPPLGACGPTGLCEPEANLAVARRLQQILQQRGAQVTMTRSSPASVSLRARTALADSLDAELFVSVHNNALPDGINPFRNSGTATFYNHLPSLELARSAQRELVAGFGLRDLGVARGDLAVVRPTWYPAILTEGFFLMFPEQENALRTVGVQQGYAEAVARGIENYLRSMASEIRRR